MKLTEIERRKYEIKRDYKKADDVLKQKIIYRLRASPVKELANLADELENVQTLVSWLKPT